MNHRFPLLVMVLAVCGAGVGARVLLDPGGAPGTKSQPAAFEGKRPDPPFPIGSLLDPNQASERERSEYFIVFGPGAIWAFCFVLLFALSFGAIGYGASALYRTGAARLRELLIEPREWQWGGFVAVCAMTLLFAGPFIVGATTNLPAPVGVYLPVLGYQWKLNVLLPFTFCAVLVFLVLLLRTNAACDRAATLPDVRNLLAALRIPFLGLGLLVSLVALGTAGMRTGLNQYHLREVLRLEPVVVYGLYYTFALCVLYAPIHLRAVGVAHRVVEAAFPDAPDGAAPAQELVAQQREAALKRLGVGGWDDTLKSAVFVLSPLLTTVVALVLPSK